MPWTCSSHLQWLQANLAATRAQEVQIQENITISHTSNVLEPITLLQKESLKYTCVDCVYKQNEKSHGKACEKYSGGPDCSDDRSER